MQQCDSLRRIGITDLALTLFGETGNGVCKNFSYRRLLRVGMGGGQNRANQGQKHAHSEE